MVYYTIFLYQVPASVGNPVLELIGAGRPINIQISIGKDALGGMQKLGLMDAGNELTAPLKLLDETQHELLILVEIEDQERAVRINKSSVRSVVYLP